MERLPIDVLVKMALELDLPEILKYCLVSKKFNTSVCMNRDFWILKLRKDFNISYDKSFGDPKLYYKRYLLASSILNKIKRWTEADVDLYELYPTNNIYDLMYDLYSGNHENVGVNIIGQIDGMGQDVLDNFLNLTHEYLFYYNLDEKSDDLEKYGIHIDSKILDNIPDHITGIVYDYDLMKNVYFKIEDDETFIKIYKEATGTDPEILRNYPQIYSSELRKHPKMLDRKYLHEHIRNNSDDHVDFINGEIKADVENSDNESDNEAEIIPGLLVPKLTDEEIEFLIDIHFRVLNPNDPLKINSLATLENLAQNPV